MAIAKRAFSFNYKIIKKGNKENDPSLWIGATSLRAIDRVKISPMIIHLLCLLSYLFTYSSLFPLAFHSTPSFRQLILQTFVFSSSFLLSSKIKRSLIRSRRKVKKKRKKRNIQLNFLASWDICLHRAGRRRLLCNLLSTLDSFRVCTRN